MNMETRVTTDTGERPIPPGVLGRASRKRLTEKRTEEIIFDLERSRRFSTLEVRWDQGLDGLTIDDVQVDQCIDVASRIMEVLPFDQFELESADAETIRYRILSSEWALEKAVFLRKSLQRLAEDPHRAVKIEYLQRDLLWSTRSRRSFIYPNALRHELDS